jgi:hypothetical protein
VSWRYQKRIRVLPGVHLNLSMSGVGVSIGGRGAHVGWTARRRRYVSFGLPGTGLSWREYERQRRKVQPMVRPAPCELCQPGHAHVGVWVVVMVVAMVLIVAIAMGTGTR